MDEADLRATRLYTGFITAQKQTVQVKDLGNAIPGELGQRLVNLIKPHLEVISTAVLSDSKEGARQSLLKQAYESYPESEGWEGHNCGLTEVPDTLVAAAFVGARERLAARISQDDKN